eukprot:CAMPEP_0174294176 /NCGR_PEP_ID=MMETSP0809-20121228/40841_1 /TAXON_ID=73025 ORGANISM="Eutreptiella gymnastica-like, Strain CCMP1594" /NCGR_SAMPLE_ID=MMETSP0809 /ASSEMBLY_ACC=CAM_ASM_000658 /LENGTH=56 /DNA_ID=CAMNT_0015395445 /DNA_START=1 /DNA_END=167 /DNA_ORIENTATION=+
MWLTQFLAKTGACLRPPQFMSASRCSTFVSKGLGLLASTLLCLSAWKENALATPRA